MRLRGSLSNTGFTPFGPSRTKRLKPRLRRRGLQTGFTLIETLVVITITSLLVLILFSTYSGSQSRARFHDSVENLASTLETLRSDANATFNGSTSVNVGKDTNYVAWATYAIFAPNSTTFTTGTLKAKIGIPDTGALGEVALADTAVTNTMKSGVKSTQAGQVAVVFARDMANGNLVMYVTAISNPIDLYTGGTPPPIYNSTSIAASLPITLADATGHTATLTANAKTGAITIAYTSS